VLLRSDLESAEWAELRRRLSDVAIFSEMFDVTIEARAEGLALIDEDGEATDSMFPRTGTVGHAALLLLTRATTGHGAGSDMGAPPVLGRHDVEAIMTELADRHRRYWSQLAEDPARLTDAVLDLLEDHRLIAIEDHTVTLMPTAWRYGIEEVVADGSGPVGESSQPALGTLR
jgi:uncharacterized protein (TIGR02678 family)